MSSNLMMLIKTLVIFLLLDFVYLNLASSHFNKLVKNIQGEKIKLKIVPTVLCYFSLIFGLYYFVLRNNKSKKEKIIDSSVLGFVIYSVYEFTNAAILKDWDTKSVIMDTIWGTTLYSLTTTILLHV